LAGNPDLGVALFELAIAVLAMRSSQCHNFAAMVAAGNRFSSQEIQ
jgi:hypothetical protein